MLYRKLVSLVLLAALAGACAPDVPKEDSQVGVSIGTRPSEKDYSSEVVLLDEHREPVWTQGIGWTSDRPLFASGDLLIGVTEDQQTQNFEAIALQTKDGKVAWRTEIPVESHIHQLRLEGERLLVLHFGGMMAVDTQTGKLLWSRLLDGETTSDFASDESTAYVSTHSGRTVAIDLATGELKWSHKTARRGGSLDPRLYGDQVIVGRSSGPLFALDAGTGSVQWRFRAPPRGRFRMSMGVVGSTLVLLEPGKRDLVDKLKGFALHDRRYVWAKRINDWLRVWMLNGRVAATKRRGLVGFDAQSGNTTWRLTRTELGLGETRPFTHILASEGDLIFGISRTERQKSSLWKLDPSGEIAWTLREPHDLLGPWPTDPAVMAWRIGTSVPCGCPGQLIAVDSESGLLAWELATQRPVQTEPVQTDQGSVVVLSDFEIAEM